VKTAYEWKSGFAEAAQSYISLKQQTGMKFEIQERYLRHFDTFYYCNGFEGSTLTKEIINDFVYGPNERPVSHHNKEVLMRDFAMYLADRGHHAYVAEVKTVLPRCKFVPHIFTDEETRRLFTAIDNYPQARMSYRNAVDPVLFRFLYGTGVRISEALNLVLKDVNAESGTVTIRAAKNMKDRLIPMADSLTKSILAFMNGFRSVQRWQDVAFPGLPQWDNGADGQKHGVQPFQGLFAYGRHPSHGRRPANPQLPPRICRHMP